MTHSACSAPIFMGSAIRMVPLLGKASYTALRSLSPVHHHDHAICTRESINPSGKAFSKNEPPVASNRYPKPFEAKRLALFEQRAGDQKAVNLGAALFCRSPLKLACPPPTSINVVASEKLIVTATSRNHALAFRHERCVGRDIFFIDRHRLFAVA